MMSELALVLLNLFRKRSRVVDPGQQACTVFSVLHSAFESIIIVVSCNQTTFLKLGPEASSIWEKNHLDHQNRENLMTLT